MSSIQKCQGLLKAEAVANLLGAMRSPWPDHEEPIIVMPWFLGLHYGYVFHTERERRKALVYEHKVSGELIVVLGTSEEFGYTWNTPADYLERKGYSDIDFGEAVDNIHRWLLPMEERSTIEIEKMYQYPIEAPFALVVSDTIEGSIAVGKKFDLCAQTKFIEHGYQYSRDERDLNPHATYFIIPTELDKKEIMSVWQIDWPAIMMMNSGPGMLFKRYFAGHYENHDHPIEQEFDVVIIDTPEHWIVLKDRRGPIAGSGLIRKPRKE